MHKSLVHARILLKMKIQKGNALEQKKQKNNAGKKDISSVTGFKLPFPETEDQDHSEQSEQSQIQRGDSPSQTIQNKRIVRSVGIEKQCRKLRKKSGQQIILKQPAARQKNSDAEQSDTDRIDEVNPKR